MGPVIVQAAQAELAAGAAQPVEPARHEELEAQRRGQIALRQRGLDRGAVLGVGQREDVVPETRGLDRPVPADRGFRAQVRRAGERAQQNPHVRAAPCSANPFARC